MKKVLIICGPKLGDVVVRVPIIEYLKRYKFDVYVFQETWSSFGRKFLENFNLVDTKKILLLNRKKISLLKFILNYFYSFDYVFCTAPTTKRTKFLGKSLFPKKKILYYDFNPIDKQCVIESDKINLKKLLKLEMINYSLFDFSYILTRKLSNIKVNPIKILIFPGMEIRSFTQECWDNILEYLTEKFDKIALIGGKDTLWLYINKKFKNVLDLRNKIDFLTTCSYIKACDFLITANSGIMWLAGLLGKKVIAFHGPSRWMWELSDKNFLNIRNWDYKKCLGFPCETGKFCNHKIYCLKTIKPNDIIQNFEEAFKKLNYQ